MKFTNKKILKTRKYQVIEKFVVMPVVGVLRAASKLISKALHL